MCFSVLALYCKQSKPGVKSSCQQWLKKVKCAAGLDKIWVSNAFCEQALRQNSFSGHPALLPFPNMGWGESSHTSLHCGLGPFGWPCLYSGSMCRYGARQLPTLEINEPLSCAAALQSLSLPSRTWPDSCVVAGVWPGCWACPWKSLLTMHWWW